MSDNDLSSSNVIKGITILILLTVTFSWAVDMFLGSRVNYDLDMRSEDYLGILMHLAILSLIIERFVEIFTSVIRKPARVDLVADLRKATNDDERHLAMKTLEAYKAKTGIFAITISFVTGLIVASVGIRVLGPLFDTNSLTPFQNSYFDAIDIIITAGLIAGGSKGVNALTSSVGAVFDAMKIQSRVTEEKAKKDIAKI